MTPTSHNPYAPPVADVADILPSSILATEPPFFAVSLLKLSVMSLCTFGGYEVYWFYKNWQRIADREGESLSPFWRAIFAVFYAYPCFSRMRAYGVASEHHASLHALPLAIGFIVASLTWRQPDPWGWISALSFVFLLPVQRFANAVNMREHPSHDPNSRFRRWNWLAICLGGPLMLFAIAGLFIDSLA